MAHIKVWITNVELFRLHGSPCQSEEPNTLANMPLGSAAVTECLRFMGESEGGSREWDMKGRGRGKGNYLGLIMGLC